MSAIKLLSLLIVMTFLETANFIHVPTRAESFEHNGVLLALKYNKAANEYVSNLKDKPSSKSTSEAAWDFAQAASDYLNYTQNKDNLRKNDFLKNPNPLTNSKKLETVIEQTKIKGVAKPSNTVTIIVPAKNSESKSQYPSLNAIFNQNMAQYYLQKKHSKTAPAKADKEAKKVKSANKEKILLLKAKRPVSKAASFNKQAMMSTQREALKINNNLTPVLRLQMTNNHPKTIQNHHQRVQTVQNPSTLSHQIKPLSANSPRMSSAPHLSQHQHQHQHQQHQQHQQKAHHQQQHPLQNSQRTLHPSQTYRPSSSQVAQTPVLSYSKAPYLVQTPQPLYYQPSRPVTNLWPNLFNVPHFNIGDILERGRSTKLKENSETAEEKTKTLQAVTTQIGEDEEDEDEDEDEEDVAEIEEENEDNEEDEENVTDVEEPDETEDDVEDDNEDTDDDSFINQLSMQRPPLFAAAPRLANHYENEFEIPAPQNLNDFVPLRPSRQSNEDNIENARIRLHQIRQHLADSQLNNNPISVSSPNLVTGQLNRPFLNQLNNENQRLVNVPRRAGSIHQLKLTKPINDEDEKEDEKDNEKEDEKEDQDQDSQEDKDENVDSEDENESKSSEPEPKSTSTNDQKENVDNEDESEKSEEDPKSSTSTDDSSKDDVESLDDELNKCLSDLEGNDSTEKSSPSKVTFSNLQTCLERLYSSEKESQESKNEDENKESESNDDVDERLPLL